MLPAQPPAQIAQAFTFPYQRASVGLARDRVQSLYGGLEKEHLERVVCAASEVVTNAVRYGAVVGQTFRLVCHDLDNGFVRLEVVDHNPTAPRLYQLDEIPWDAPGGRGLALLCAEGARIGCRRAGSGKVVVVDVPAIAPGEEVNR